MCETSSVRGAIPIIDIGRRPDRRDAVRLAGSYCARSARALPAQRATVRMRERIVLRLVRVIWMVAEDVVEPVEPGAQTMCGRLEHMFERVDDAPDGTAAVRYVP
jgi:hypothetical protein